jgi:dihydrofolate synthase/folylpolyglutamate synthase
MRFRTLDEWLSWQESLHPSEIDLGLERVHAVLQRLNHPQLNCPVITVAGTNGKGSSVAMFEAIYLAAGYRVGAYTSPHLLHYNERVRINGEPVGDNLLCEAFEKVDQARSNTSLTYFEFGTLAAIEIFAKTNLDVVILEVGLGGRLDAVNILDADVALITPIDLDHGAWLGNDRDSIGYEKAGIMRAGRPAVCADVNPPATVQQHADATGARLYQVNRDFEFRNLGGQWRWYCGDRIRDALPLPALRGRVQLGNAAAVLMVTELLTERLPLSQSHVREGLANVTLAGRFQVMPGEVPLILDVAHNSQAAGALASTLAAWPTPGRTYAVVAMMADKDIAAILRAMLPVVDEWCLTTVDLQRAATTERLVQTLSEVAPGAPFLCADSVMQALQEARRRARAGDRIVVFGSFHTVAAALQEDYNAGHLSPGHKKAD